MARDQSRRGESSHPAQPFEQLYHHHAGLAGYGGSSYIDLVIARDRDTNTGSAGFETREYVLQNWRADVVALAAPDGDLLERVTYDAYGIPFATHPTDLTTGNTGGVAGYGMPNGVLDANDYNYFLTLYGNTDFRADWNRDGVFDTGDSFAYLADYTAATGTWGRGVLSNRGSILGYAGYIHEPATGSAGNGHGSMYHCRLRVHHAGLGRWIQRDPPQFEYGEGMSLYPYCAHDPVERTDPDGGPPCGGWSTSRGDAIINNKTDCQCCVDALWRSDPSLQIIKDQINQSPSCLLQRGCTSAALRKPLCTNSPVVHGMGGAYFRSSCQILINADDQVGLTCGDLSRLVFHEVYHAWSFCIYNPTTTCEECLCEEVKANRYGGQCCPGTPTLNNWGPDPWDCLGDRAMASCESQCPADVDPSNAVRDCFPDDAPAPGMECGV